MSTEQTIGQKTARFLDEHCAKVACGIALVIFIIAMVSSSFVESDREQRERERQEMRDAIIRIEANSAETLDKVNALNANFEELLDTEETQ